MPIYDYDCETCGVECERNVPVDDRDKQFCECGAVLKRRLAQVQIVVPAAFGTSFSDIGPSNEYSEETWRKDGIRPVGSRWV